MHDTIYHFRQISVRPYQASLLRPPWLIVHQQAMRWLAAGVFEAMVHDWRVLLRDLAGRKPRSWHPSSHNGARGAAPCQKAQRAEHLA